MALPRYTLDVARSARPRRLVASVGSANRLQLTDRRRHRCRRSERGVHWRGEGEAAPSR